MKITGTNFHRRSIAAANAETAKLRDTLNRYEAAIPSTDRSWIPSVLTDERFDSNSMTRLEIARKIDYFAKNVWLVQSLEEQHKKWTVGPNGLQIIPDSSDKEWNKRFAEAYSEWCESPCLDSTITMPQVHRQIAGNDHIFGGVFINKTRRKESGKPSIPAIQIIPTHRCSSPAPDYSFQDNPECIDGVQLELDAATGKPTKPIGYWVRDGLAGTEWTFRSTRDMHHVFDPRRTGSYRELSPYHASLNPLHDLDDLEVMEMQKAKQNSEIASILTNSSGEIPPHLARKYLNGPGAQPSANPVEADINIRLNQYKRILGSRMISLKKDEDIKQFVSENPSAATQWYWQYKIGQVCSAVNVPLILVFPELSKGMQGTVVRGVYDNAHEFFRTKFFLYAHAAVVMYRFFGEWARYNDRRCVDAPADWKKCHVIPPRAVNVDIGYNAAATLADLEAGITNWDDIAGRYGTTAEVLIRKKAKNVRMIHDIAKEEGVEPSEISAPIADVIQKLAMAQQSEALAEQADSNNGTEAEPASTRKRTTKKETVEV